MNELLCMKTIGSTLKNKHILIPSPKVKVTHSKKHSDGDFPGGAVVKNPPAIAGDTGSSPGPGRSHMPQSN